MFARMQPFPFSAEHVASLRRAIAAAWKLPAELPAGWSHSPVRPAITACKHLSFESGWNWDAWVYTSGTDGTGRLRAAPANQAFPEVTGENDPANPPRSTIWTRAPLLVLRGDGSSASWLEAAVLAQEAEEFGARGKNVEWGAAVVIDAPPWASPACKDPSEESEWTWSGPVPKAWGPRVELGKGRVRVTWHTWSPVGQERITRWVHAFDRKAWHPDVPKGVEETILAVGQRGIVW
jgi:hypothetical protein